MNQGNMPEQQGREAEHSERPILENSTACTMSNAKNILGIEPFWFGVGIPLGKHL